MNTSSLNIEDFTATVRTELYSFERKYNESGNDNSISAKIYNKLLFTLMCYITLSSILLKSIYQNGFSKGQNIYYFFKYF